jgi:hypothetical protein
MQKLSLLFVFLFLSKSSFGQHIAERSIGVKAGLNLGGINNMRYYERVEVSLLKAPFGGIYTVFKPLPKFAVQPELIYSVQGINSKSYYRNTDIRLNYLNIPVIAKTYIGSRFNIQFGPQVGFLVSAREKGIQRDYTLKVSDVNNNIRKAYKNADLAFCLGFGFDLPASLEIAARLNFGITNIEKNHETILFAEGNGNGPVANRVFQFSLGYKLKPNN